MKNLDELNDKVQESASFVSGLKKEIGRVIVGQAHMVDCAIIALLTGGHVLLEGVPGLAKTLLCNTLAQVVSCQFKRIQFTPDLLPADVIGSMAYRQEDGTFYVKKGPIFANLVLADEINRAPAKVQSALLEAMQEKQVTIGETTYLLPKPFLVIATQNPIDQEGTYALPEAQVDRFMLKAIIDYPTLEEEKTILDRMSSGHPIEVSPVTNGEKLIKAAENVSSIYIDPRTRDYIVNIIQATRHPEQYGMKNLQKYISRGSGPRGTLSLASASKASAFMEKRAFVTPDDVQKVIMDVLRHRISLTYEAEVDNISAKNIIDEILKKIDVP